MIVTEQGEVPFGLLVWSTGLAPNPLVSSITELQKDKKSGRTIQVDGHLNAIRADGTPDPNIWVIGDAAQVPDAILPATAQGVCPWLRILERFLMIICRIRSRQPASKVPDEATQPHCKGQIRRPRVRVP